MHCAKRSLATGGERGAETVSGLQSGYRAAQEQQSAREIEIILPYAAIIVLLTTYLPVHPVAEQAEGYWVYWTKSRA